MIILFLGTGAGDWQDEHRETYEKEFRRHASVLVNNDLLIDPGPNVLSYAKELEIDLDKIKNILVTHTHSDHYSSETVRALCIGKECTLWGDTGNLFYLNENLSKNEIMFSSVAPFKEYKIGNYSVIPVKSNHHVENPIGEQTLNYIIKDSGNTVFYGSDGAWIPCESWIEMRKHIFDTLIIDCTIGDDEGDMRIFEHNNIRMVETMAQTFRKCKIIKKGGNIIATHLARTLHPTQAEVCERLKPLDIIPAYDGMKISI